MPDDPIPLTEMGKTFRDAVEAEGDAEYKPPPKPTILFPAPLILGSDGALLVLTFCPPTLRVNKIVHDEVSRTLIIGLTEKPRKEQASRSLLTRILTWFWR